MTKMELKTKEANAMAEIMGDKTTVFIPKCTLMNALSNTFGAIIC